MQITRKGLDHCFDVFLKGQITFVLAFHIECGYILNSGTDAKVKQIMSSETRQLEILVLKT